MARIRNPYLILLLLTVAYTLSFMDRYVMNLLLGDVKTDFHLSEMQAGLLAGAGFAVLYALMAMPMGIMADRRGRMRLAAAGVALWSVFTTCCGLSRSFVQLILCRVGVGVGEATLTPAAYPVIKSLFRSERLSTALGIYSAGIYIGSGLAYWLGGKALVWIRAEHLISYFPAVSFDWQLVFLLFGIPGLVLAALLLLVKAPVTIAATPFDLHAFKGFLKEHNYRFVKLSLASALFNVAVYAVGVWLPVYLQRVHRMSIADSGALLGATMVFIAPVGAIAGGIIGDLANTRYGVRGRISVVMISIAMIIACFIGLAVSSAAHAFYLPLIGLSLLLSVPVAVTVAIVQEMTPDHMRSTAPAFLITLQNLIGMSLGPTLVAVLTQYVFRDEMSVGLSVSVTGICFCILSVIVLRHTQKKFI